MSKAATAYNETIVLIIVFFERRLDLDWKSKLSESNINKTGTSKVGAISKAQKAQTL